MKGKNVTIFGLGAIGGFIGGNVFAFYKMLHSKRIRKALTDIVADKIETVLYEEECHSPKNNSRVSYSYYHKNKNIRNKSGFVLEDILFGTESDALSVLSSMKEIRQIDFRFIKMVSHMHHQKEKRKSPRQDPLPFANNLI